MDQPSNSKSHSSGVTSANILDGYKSNSNVTEGGMRGSDFPSPTYGTTEALTKYDYGVDISAEENPHATILSIRARRQEEGFQHTVQNITLIGFYVFILAVIILSVRRFLPFLIEYFSNERDKVIISPNAIFINSSRLTSVADELAKLRDLRNQGVLTQEEFERQKNNLLT